MGKKHKFLGLSKWIMIGLILAAFWVAGKQQSSVENLSFFQVGKEVIKDSFTKRMLYSQSVILGVLLEQESGLTDLGEEVKVESFLPFTEEEYVSEIEKESIESFIAENAVAVENKTQEIYLGGEAEFAPVNKKQIEINKKDYLIKEDFIKRFYTVDPTTTVEDPIFDIEKLSSIDCRIDKTVNGPQILLYHTHSQEAFVDSEMGKEEDSIVGAGEILADYLRSYGFDVYHHKGEYDVKNRDYAYSNSLPEIQKILEENPSIQVVIDLHRDAVAETTRLVTQVQGKNVAKVMFFNGLGRTKDKGEISYLKNPYLNENLAFSFQMKLACDEYYPGFARNIYLRAYRYNMHLCPKTLLVELGAQTNTKEEIRGALAPLSHVLWLVLSGENVG